MTSRSIQTAPVLTARPVSGDVSARLAGAMAAWLDASIVNEHGDKEVQPLHGRGRSYYAFEGPRESGGTYEVSADGNAKFMRDLRAAGHVHVGGHTCFAVNKSRRGDVDFAFYADIPEADALREDEDDKAFALENGFTEVVPMCHPHAVGDMVIDAVGRKGTITKVIGQMFVTLDLGDLTICAEGKRFSAVNS